LAAGSDAIPSPQQRMRELFNDLSIRGKLMLLISGSVCLFTAGVLAVVWVQSLRQVRTIVQEQLEANRQLFAFAQRSHYQSQVYKGTTLAASSEVVHALERNDPAAACAFLVHLLAAPSVNSKDDPELDYISIRHRDGSLLEMLEQSGSANPAGERKWLALIFSDVRGFMAFPKTATPHSSSSA